MMSNELTELNGSQFFGLDSLRHLRLSFNKISRINRNAFAGVYRLETLYLDKNKITNIHPITFRGLASLKLLSLEGNSIKSIHPTTFITLVLGNLIPFSSLQIIKLNNNFLENLHENTFRHVHQLSTLTLHNNMWDCSCRSVWLNNFLNSTSAFKCPNQQGVLDNKDCLVCSGPESLKNVPLVQLSAQAQKCEAPGNGTRFDEPQSLYPTTDLVMNNIHTIKCNTENVINSSLKHGGGNILPDGTMLIMSVTEENVICPQHISGKHLNKIEL